MDVRATQAMAKTGRDFDLRTAEQVKRLNLGGLDNGSPMFENPSNRRKESREEQGMARRPNFQRSNNKSTQDDDRKDLMRPGDMVKGRWRIINKIGGGGFGEIYQAEDTQMDSSKGILNVEYYASGLQRQSSEDALESVDSGNSSGNSERGPIANNYIVAVKTESNTQCKQMLHMEVAVLRKLKGKKNFCELISCGKTHRINYIVMTLQGRNLSELRKKAVNKSFTLSTSLRVICKCLDAVEELHSIGYLHRDIKPSNFCLRRDDPTEICLLDFGLVRPFMKPGTTNQIRPPRSSAGFRGTVRYASINAHNYRELGRHDDLWSMYYMLVEFLSGQLPWHRKSEKDVVKVIKTDTKPIELGVSAGLPQSIASTWVNHLENLNYYSTPDYAQLRKVIEVWLAANGKDWDEPYDWQRQAITRVGSAANFTPMFKRNQPTGRQFVPNTKRPALYDSTGCMKRLDNRRFGSTTELKRLESDGGGRSTAALCEDALTNKNNATEKIMQDDGNDNFEDASERLDGKKGMMGSHIDLATMEGETRKPPPPPPLPSQTTDFVVASKLLVHLPVDSTNGHQSHLPPVPPPHRRPNHDEDRVFLKPEDRPLLPPSAHPPAPPPIPPHGLESLQKRVFRQHPAYRRRKGLTDVFDGLNITSGGDANQPTPRPRSKPPERETEHPDGDNSIRDGWLCRDDIAVHNRPVNLTHNTSALSPQMARSPVGEYPILQRHRSMTSLNFAVSSTAATAVNDPNSVYETQAERWQRARRTWFELTEGKTNSVPVAAMKTGPTYQFSPRPTLEGKSNLIWHPMASQPRHF